jgi:hypothetical protein
MRRPRIPMLFLGAVLVALGCAFALDLSEVIDLRAGVVWPALLIGIGVAGLLALIPGAGRREP